MELLLWVAVGVVAVLALVLVLLFTSPFYDPFKPKDQEDGGGER
ncbi:hypothetical protein Mterra_02886 [Calidithermus terrae]|uniref:Uncharacterized protein n=1 Tax=Calidithermus terrae TaxID=1408545 RepID=A0A399EEI8_9DEIN|nr:hypothetical protein [Calidithermus terrae]RIH81953.1 hypothetical protein Mterra_02886 [Calidithermus terrae]